MVGFRGMGDIVMAVIFEEELGGRKACELQAGDGVGGNWESWG